MVENIGVKIGEASENKSEKYEVVIQKVGEPCDVVYTNELEVEL